MLSAGFIVISLFAVLVIIVPSAIVIGYGWRCGSLGRLIALVAFVLFLYSCWIAFTDPESPDFESRAFSLYVVWGCIFYSGAVLYGCIRAVSAFLDKRKA